MKVRWLGVAFVAVLVVGTLLLKSRIHHQPKPATVNGTPAVVLVADLQEADDPNDACAEIIRSVREAAKRGVRVVELPANSDSDLPRRYHVLSVPTVLFLDQSGNEVGRFEGEDSGTVKAIQMHLSALTRKQ